MQIQFDICQKYGTAHIPSYLNSKLGIAIQSLGFSGPIHGLRHVVRDETCGWYIWRGEYSEDPNFFSPIHVKQSDYCEEAIKFLGLPPGWRFLTESDHEDVWFDNNLLEN